MNVPTDLGLLSSIGICTGAAALIAAVTWRFKQPLIIAYLATGVIIGPNIGLRLDHRRGQHLDRRRDRADPAALRDRPRDRPAQDGVGRRRRPAHRRAAGSDLHRARAGVLRRLRRAQRARATARFCTWPPA